jgi:hypothetical protein
MAKPTVILFDVMAPVVYHGGTLNFRFFQRSESGGTNFLGRIVSCREPSFPSPAANLVSDGWVKFLYANNCIVDPCGGSILFFWGLLGSRTLRLFATRRLPYGSFVICRLPILPCIS